MAFWYQKSTSSKTPGMISVSKQSSTESDKNTLPDIKAIWLLKS
jgi:hypothetical protein